MAYKRLRHRGHHRVPRDAATAFRATPTGRIRLVRGPSSGERGMTPKPDRGKKWP
jgi:hypothetical protein